MYYQRKPSIYCLDMSKTLSHNETTVCPRILVTFVIVILCLKMDKIGIYIKLLLIFVEFIVYTALRTELCTQHWKDDKIES